MWQGVVFFLFFSFLFTEVVRSQKSYPPPKKKIFSHRLPGGSLRFLVSTLFFQFEAFLPSKFTIPNKKDRLEATLQASCYLPSCAVVYMVNLRIKGNQTMQVLDSDKIHDLTCLEKSSKHVLLPNWWWKNNGDFISMLQSPHRKKKSLKTKNPR